MENVLGTKTDGELKRAEEGPSSYSIALSLKDRVPYGAKNAMALYIGREIGETIQHDMVEKVFFVPWIVVKPSGSRTYAGNHS